MGVESRVLGGAGNNTSCDRAAGSRSEPCREAALAATDVATDGCRESPSGGCASDTRPSLSSDRRARGSSRERGTESLPPADGSRGLLALTDDTALQPPTVCDVTMRRSRPSYCAVPASVLARAVLSLGGRESRLARASDPCARPPAFETGTLPTWEVASRSEMAPPADPPASRLRKDASPAAERSAPSSRDRLAMWDGGVLRRGDRVPPEAPPRDGRGPLRPLSRGRDAAVAVEAREERWWARWPGRSADESSGPRVDPGEREGESRAPRGERWYETWPDERSEEPPRGLPSESDDLRRMRRGARCERGERSSSSSSEDERRGRPRTLRPPEALGDGELAVRVLARSLRLDVEG